MAKDDFLADVMAIGQRNREILELAQAWCRHVRRDRGPLGVGIPEQVTGLPISGGSLACDYAKPQTTFAMQLEHSAANFYRQNCVGCKYHAPTGREPNLRTWAEEVIHQEETEVREAEAAATVRESERQHRLAQRRQIFGQLSAFTSEVLDLVERLDADQPDRTAGEELIAEARLHPESFTTELIGMLVVEARRPGMDACLQVLFELHHQSNRPDAGTALGLAIAGLRLGSAIDECADIVGELASKSDVLDLETVFERLVEAAGRHRWMWHAALEPHPTGLIRYYELAPNRAEERLARELRRGEPWRRSIAAHATRRLVEQHPEAAMTMLRHLLEGLKVGDPPRMSSEEVSAPAFARAIAAVISEEAVAADQLISEYLSSSTDEYRAKAMHAYSAVLQTEDRKRAPIDAQTAQVVAERALKELLAAKEQDLVSAAGSTLEQACEDFGAEIKLSVDVILGGLVMLAGEQKDLDAPTTNLDFLTRTQTENRINLARRHLRDGLASLANATPEQIWTGLLSSWESAEPALRHEILGVLKRAARGQRQRLPQLLPLIFTAMCSSEQSDRRDALDILIALADYQPLALPDTVIELAIAMLGDQYLIVQRAAVELIPRLTVPDDQRLGVITVLLQVAHAYAGDRLRDNMVRDAMSGALQLSHKEEEAIVIGAVLSAIDRMPAFNAAETLSRFRILEVSPRWGPSAVRALRVDEDPGYADLGEDDRAYLVTALARHPAELGPHVSQLVAIGKERANYHEPWGWAIAELLSVGAHQQASAEIAQFIEESIPTTHEKRFNRAYAHQITCNFKYELAIALGDMDAATAALKEAESVPHSAESD